MEKNINEEKERRIEEATREWVNGFNAVEQELIKESLSVNIDNWGELTPLVKGDYVVGWSSKGEVNGEIEEVNYEEETAIVDGEEFDLNELEKEQDFLPMWGTMWEFKDICDQTWLEDNLQAVADCGFRIYESEDYGYLIGIDGAGYDFYEAHWLPLYKARGLHWHKEDKEESENE